MQIELQDTKTGKTYSNIQTLTPDAFLFIAKPDGQYYFYPIEVEQDKKKNSNKTRDKTRAYVALQQEPALFLKVLENILPSYGLPAPKKATFQPLFITANEQMRNRQLMLSAAHTTISDGRTLANFLQFCSLDDLIKTPRGQTWITQKSVGNKIINEFVKKETTIKHRMLLYQWAKGEVDRTKKGTPFPG